jgi:trimeric autotransporter adhesin
VSIRRAQDERIEGTPDGLGAITEIMDTPDAPSVSAADVGTSRAYNNGAATVTMTAAATGGTPATYNVISTPGSFTATGASPVTVTGLQSGTAYTFQATGVTSGAVTGIQSGASSSITATTVPATPSAPTATDQPSGRAYNNGQASVAFTAPTTGGKTISSYTVTSSPGSFTNTGSSSPITVTGLQSGTAYTYTLTATNANGTSSASSALSAVTATTVPQAPTIGTATAGNAQASVTFTAGATGGSAITGYTVTSSPGNITATGSSSPITITGLTNGTAYTFTATATNANGTSSASSASNSVSPVIPSTVPGTPTMGSADATGTSTATVYFSAPSTDGGSAINYYTVNMHNSSGAYLYGQNVGGSPAGITGLSAGSFYYFKVYAHNANGYGGGSEFSNLIRTSG